MSKHKDLLSVFQVLLEGFFYGKYSINVHV